jgi:signal transduction histidine kinase
MLGMAAPYVATAARWVAAWRTGGDEVVVVQHPSGTQNVTKWWPSSRDVAQASAAAYGAAMGITVIATLIGALVVGVAIGWVLARRRSPAAATTVGAGGPAASGWLLEARPLVDSLPFASLLIEPGGRVGHANAVARQEFPLLAPGHDPGEVSASLAEILARTAAGSQDGTRETVFLGEPPRALRVTACAFDGRVVATLIDVTEDVDFEEARRTFSAAVSHELRTPLARILGLAESLVLPNSDAEREELVTQIEHEVDGMRQLIDEMLLLAALDRGRLAVADGTVDASAMAFEVVEAARQRRVGRGRDITLTAENGIEVPVASRLFEVVIQNLLDNALLHGGPDAAVRVTVAAEGAEAVVTVADTGRGIQAQHLPFVFQRFYRGDASRTGQGSGLGLALVKHIVEAHGGTVAAESDGATGTTLRVTLPLAD